MTALVWHQVSPSVATGDLPSDDPHDAAFARQGGLSAFLDAAATAGEPVTLVVNDPYRSTQTRAALAAIARFCAQRERERKLTAPRPRGNPRFRALVATGTHVIAPDRRRQFEEVALFSGDLRVEGVAWHDSQNVAHLREINGYFFHPLIADSRFLLPIGSVEPHYFAGVTGPHKTVTIGCLSHADIERNHFHALHPESDVMRLSGNPVYDSIAEMLRALEVHEKQIFAISQVVSGATVLHAAAGPCLATVQALLPAVRAHYVRKIDRPADALRLRVSGPLSDNLYQADKALKNNHRAVRDGGSIILEADCAEGVGPDQFIRLLRESADYASACRIVSQRGYRLGDHKAVKIRHLTDRAGRNVRVLVVSNGLTPADLEGTGLTLCASIHAAQATIAAHARSADGVGIIVDDAANTCVVVRDD